MPPPKPAPNARALRASPSIAAVCLASPLLNASVSRSNPAVVLTASSKSNPRFASSAD